MGIDSAIMEAVTQGVATYPEIMQRTQQADIVKKRWQVWAFLIEKGFNKSEIARRFKMNPATVRHGLIELKRIAELDKIKSKIIKFN